MRRTRPAATSATTCLFAVDARDGCLLLAQPGDGLVMLKTPKDDDARAPAESALETRRRAWARPCSPRVEAHQPNFTGLRQSVSATDGAYDLLLPEKRVTS